MITIKKMKWSNMFSYGKDNEIDFTRSGVTQIIGVNGSGKSSIPMILEELLYNKNSKGTKKAEVPNRHTGDTKYSGYVSFNKDEDEYEVTIERASSGKVTLLKNGENISSHTAANTLKQLESIIGDPYNVFSQKIYQGMTSSLQFLTDTDTARKKFLVSLLNLSEYGEYESRIKTNVVEYQGEIKALASTVEELKTWLAKASTIEESKEYKELPEEPTEPKKILQECYAKIQNASLINKEAAKAEKILAEMLNIVIPNNLEEKVNTDSIKDEITRTKVAKAPFAAVVEKLSKLNSTKCPTCLSELDKERIATMILEAKERINEQDQREAEANKRLVEAEKRNRRIEEAKRAERRYKDLRGSLEGLNTEFVDVSAVEALYLATKKEVEKVEVEMKKVAAYNSAAKEHNAKLEQIHKQQKEISQRLEKSISILKKAEEDRAVLQVLQKAFSSKGIVAYKLECMVKDLEDEINNYLVDLSDGRFNLNFVLQGDKLNVIITDNGQEITMTALSSGEQARVNISTVLAVRKIMTILSQRSVNLLFLDEIVSVLDEGGRAKLVEILLKDNTLNTFIISHGWRHPLVPRLIVKKQDNISRIKND